MKITKVTPNNINNFNKEIKTPGLIAFVKIYSDGCHHCKDLEPKWDKMEKDLKNENLEGLIASLPFNLTKQADCDTDDVMGVPTLRVLQGGKKKFDYEGHRETEAMKSFVKNLLKKQKGGKRKAKKGGEGSLNKHIKNYVDELNKPNTNKKELEKHKGLYLNAYARHMGVARKTGKIFKKDNKVILQSFDQRVENEKQSRWEAEERKKREQQRIIEENLKRKEVEDARDILVSKKLGIEKEQQQLQDNLNIRTLQGELLRRTGSAVIPEDRMPETSASRYLKRKEETRKRGPSKLRGGKQTRRKKKSRRKRRRFQRKRRRTRKKRGGLSKLGKLNVDLKIASALRNAKDKQFSKDVIELLQGIHSTRHEEPKEEELDMSELKLIAKGGKRRTRKKKRRKRKMRTKRKRR